ncbi:MAG: NUDIX hydrolase [Gammaproteobacteria bacterium]
MGWKPHVTVAAVVEKHGRFLLVEETTDNGLMFNQPAGHLEPGEDLISAVKREVQEETAWQFEPEALIAVQLWRRTPDFPSFVRFCFTGSVHSHDPDQKLDDGIIATHWLNHAEITAHHNRLRSPLVLKTLEAYLTGQRYPLTALQSFIDLA